MAGNQKTYFTGISSINWEHPADRAALSAVKAVPAFDDVLKFFIRSTSEKSLRLVFLASSVRVGVNQFPKLQTLLEEACARLDLVNVPELYVSQNPQWNAMSIGVDRPFIVINSSLVDAYTEDELLAVLGHEVGHILSGHVLYKTLLWFLLNLGTNMLGIPIGKIALSGLLSALSEWDRKSELSSDRAALLCLQDPEPVYLGLMKIAGGNHTDEMNLDSFIIQAEEYDAGGDLLDGVHKLLNLMGQTHPFPVIRLHELKKWLESGKYDHILSGEYERRNPDERSDIRREINAAREQYREDVERSKDPLANIAKNIGNNVENLRRDAENFLRSLFD